MATKDRLPSNADIWSGRKLATPKVPKPPKGPRNPKRHGFTNGLWRLEEHDKAKRSRRK